MIGGETAEFEQILAEGLGIVRKHTQKEADQAHCRSHLAQLSLTSGILADLQIMVNILSCMCQMSCVLYQ